MLETLPEVFTLHVYNWTIKSKANVVIMVTDYNVNAACSDNPKMIIITELRKWNKCGALSSEVKALGLV